MMPTLNRVPVSDAFPPRAGSQIITMSPGQWDDLLELAYESGWTLLELDEQDWPVKAYRRPHGARKAGGAG